MAIFAIENEVPSRIAAALDPMPALVAGFMPSSRLSRPIGFVEGELFAQFLTKLVNI